ncbi:MAG TPA: 16S rRNA (guanine(527)-N(7))-methyltransferase RsmG [Vicinamibacterales bacterium]|nr:16S rRNA (guanine(527)-N(7))-methyltransferase RsmG [Vicinamibacterales bacterium]
MSSREFRDRLRRRAKAAGVTLDPNLIDGLETYYQLLTKWNAKINLTAFSLTPEGEDQAIDRLLIEPVAAARYVPENARTLLDAGSGGGSPALPLRLASPQLSLRMVEVKTRKGVFLREAVRALGLRNADVETSRFEELLSRPELHEGQDLVSIRAVRIELRTLNTLQAFLRPGGKLLLFRGASKSELEDSPPPPLSWMATYPLVDSLHSKLVVLSKFHVER